MDTPADGTPPTTARTGAPTAAGPTLRSTATLAAAFTAALATGLLAGCAPAPDPDVLLEADRAFAADVAAGGADAWASWFAEDGAMIQEGTGEIRGRDAIRAAVAYLDQDGPSLTWDPARADLAASGDLGWTTGSWTFRAAPDVDNVTRGRYVSIWRKQVDGSWKVVMDLGNPVDED